eukprot:scaffold11381_cov68-Phaeocystis_antarctica.AAC.10
MAAAQHARGVTLDHVERAAVCTHHAWHARPDQAGAQLGRADRDHERLVVAWGRRVTPHPLAQLLACAEAGCAAAIARRPGRLGEVGRARPVPNPEVVLAPAMRTNEPLLARLEPDATFAVGGHDLERRLHGEHAAFEDSPLQRVR